MSGLLRDRAPTSASAKATGSSSPTGTGALSASTPRVRAISEMRLTRGVVRARSSRTLSVSRTKPTPRSERTSILKKRRRAAMKQSSQRPRSPLSSAICAVSASPEMGSSVLSLPKRRRPRRRSFRRLGRNRRSRQSERRSPQDRRTALGVATSPSSRSQGGVISTCTGGCQLRHSRSSPKVSGSPFTQAVWSA